MNILQHEQGGGNLSDTHDWKGSKCLFFINQVKENFLSQFAFMVMRNTVPMKSSHPIQFFLWGGFDLHDLCLFVVQFVVRDKGAIIERFAHGTAGEGVDHINILANFRSIN